MRIAIIGTGYVGLVTGVCLADMGHSVICIDVDEAKVAKLLRGEAPIYEPGIEELLQKNLQADSIHFSDRLTDITQSDVLFFALPTPSGSDGQADLSFVLGAARDVARTIKRYTVIVNKSTVPVGTARKVRDIVANETDVPFDVVSNPEFLREGHAVEDFMQSNRIVIGTSSKKAQMVMEQVYEPFTNAGTPLFVMDEASSEMTKYAANSFLVMKISFMNEIANLCELVGANVDNVKRGIGADERIGDRFLNAGIGYGGSCFPKDVLALHKTANLHGYNFKLLDAILQVNVRQKQRLVEKVVEHYGDNLTGKTFALWGLAFKPNTDDTREAPSHDIIRELLGRGARIQAYDPEAVENTKRVFTESGIAYSESAEQALNSANALLIVTEWEEFAVADVSLFAKQLKDKLVFDGRNIYSLDNIRNSGITYISIGRESING